MFKSGIKSKSNVIKNFAKNLESAKAQKIVQAGLGIRPPLEIRRGLVPQGV